MIVSGKLTTFAGSSKYQIVIDTLEPAGIGALMKLLEERKKKLAAEGLFDEARKQLLPFLPNVIGVVTSPTGAVIRDILHRLADRFPRRVLVWPVRVQGENSAAEVAECHQWLQRIAGAWRAAAAGSDHRRARRRLARGSAVVQRRGRGAGGGREHDPADFRGRPRDRRHVDRFCLRPPRADADRRRRNGGAGAQRTHRRRSPRCRSASWPAGSVASTSAARNCACCHARCRRPMNCSPTRASGSTPWRSGCRAPCTRTRSFTAPSLTHAAASLTPRLLKLRLARSSEIVVTLVTARPTRTRELSGAPCRPSACRRTTAGGFLLSRRAGARLRLGARRRRPSAACGRRGYQRNAAGDRIFRRSRRRHRRRRGRRGAAGGEAQAKHRSGGEDPAGQEAAFGGRTIRVVPSHLIRAVPQSEGFAAPPNDYLRRIPAPEIQRRPPLLNRYDRSSPDERGGRGEISRRRFPRGASGRLRALRRDRACRSRSRNSNTGASTGRRPMPRRRL